MDSTKHFLFITNDVHKPNRQVTSALDICKKLLQDRFWAFTNNAPNTHNLRLNDHVLIYVAGVVRRYFLASATVSSLLVNFENGSNELETLNELGLGFMKTGIYLKDITQFTAPVQIGPLLPVLQFIKDKKNYGLHLRLPIVKVDVADYKLIEQASLK